MERCHIEKESRISIDSSRRIIGDYTQSCHSICSYAETSTIGPGRDSTSCRYTVRSCISLEPQRRPCDSSRRCYDRSSYDSIGCEGSIIREIRIARISDRYIERDTRATCSGTRSHRNTDYIIPGRWHDARRLRTCHSGTDLSST